VLQLLTQWCLQIYLHPVRRLLPGIMSCQFLKLLVVIVFSILSASTSSVFYSDRVLSDYWYVTELRYATGTITDL